MTEEKNIKTVKIPSSITVKKFAEILDIPVGDVITALMNGGIIASINETIDFETASIIAQELGFSAEEDISQSKAGMKFEDLLTILGKEKESGENLKPRSPIVTILGHVDHGKTTLLDTIRKANVAGQESGGITQAISAYQVKHKGNQITFVDTPGHEAFSGMRERGASLTDIAILIVAADDGVRPQTKEVIKYLVDGKIPTVVAINKIDKPEANIQRVKQELADNGILLEEWGGNYVHAEISAKQNININDLLDSILLVAEVEDLKADYDRNALGVVLESRVDPNRGPLATVLIKTGILKKGQDIIAGESFGRVRKLENHRGEEIQSAPPSTPVVVMGLNEIPQANDVLQAVSSLDSVKAQLREAGHVKRVSKKSGDEKIKKLTIILKADVQGSLEATHQILDAIESNEVAVEFVQEGVGSITESDVKVAQTAQAVVFGFNVEATAVAGRLAKRDGVEIKTYRIIYELVEDIKGRLSDMLEPEKKRTDFGKMKVLAIFKTGKQDMIVGGKVIEGVIKGNCQLEVKRDSQIIGVGKLTELQQNKVDVDEVKAGEECGISFEGETKIKEDDQIVCFQEEVKKRTL